MPAQRCKWARASALVTDDHVAELRSNGLVVIDGALSPDEVRAARIELADLDRCGQLAEVACQSKARVRNDRIGWVSQESAASLPALGVAMRLLRALPAEVESRAAAAAAAAGEDACYWRMAVPTLCMAAVYDGSKSKVSRGSLRSALVAAPSAMQLPSPMPFHSYCAIQLSHLLLPNTLTHDECFGSLPLSHKLSPSSRPAHVLFQAL